MWIYASHFAYCGVLAGLQAHLAHDSETRLALRVLLLFSAVNLGASLALDLWGTRYSSLSWPTFRVDVGTLCVYALVLAANVAVCAASMLAGRVVWGFSLRTEIAVSTALFLAWRVLNVRWDFANTERLTPWFKDKGIHLRSHQRWAYALSNVGLGFRLFRRVFVYAVSLVLMPTVPTLAEWLPGWEYAHVWAALISLALLPWTKTSIGLQWHYHHRALHANPTLYGLIHKPHHLARYPIPVDAGTESPIELMMHEITALTSLTPLALWAPITFFRIFGEMTSHDITIGDKLIRDGRHEEQDAHHLLHHTTNNVNMSVPSLDRWSNTIIDAAKVKPPMGVAGLPPKRESRVERYARMLMYRTKALD